MLSITSFLLAHSSTSADDFESSLPHTNVACWQGARIYHNDHASKFIPKIEKVAPSIEHPLQNQEKTVPSTNNAYTYRFINKNPQNSHAQKIDLYVHVERPYVLKISFDDINSEGLWSFSDPVWINEKLLFLRAWAGKIAGIDMILDVEAEKFIYLENFWDGEMSFQQHQEAIKNGLKFNKEAECQ